MTENEHYSLKLYVAGLNPGIQDSILGLKKILNEKFGKNYELEVVDVLIRPELAEGEKIFATPTIVRKLPGFVKKVILDLKNKDRVLIGLDFIDMKNSGEDNSIGQKE